MTQNDKPGIRKIARAILPHLPGTVFVAYLAKQGDQWTEVERWDALDQETSTEQAARPIVLTPVPLPDATVLDYVASIPKPTYLPHGEEGSEWCLAGAQCVLFLPVRLNRKPHSSLLYITGRTVDAFSPQGVQRAAAELDRIVTSA